MGAWMCNWSSPLTDNHRLSVVSTGHSGGCHRCCHGRCHGCRRRGCCCCRRGCSRSRRWRWSRGWCWKQEMPEGEGGPGLNGVHADALQQDQANRVRAKALWLYFLTWAETWLDERLSYLTTVRLTARIVIRADFITVWITAAGTLLLKLKKQSNKHTHKYPTDPVRTMYLIISDDKQMIKVVLTAAGGVTKQRIIKRTNFILNFMFRCGDGENCSLPRKNANNQLNDGQIIKPVPCASRLAPSGSLPLALWPALIVLAPERCVASCQTWLPSWQPPQKNPNRRVQSPVAQLGLSNKRKAPCICYRGDGKYSLKH